MPSNIATRSAIPPLTRRLDDGLDDGFIIPQLSCPDPSPSTPEKSRYVEGIPSSVNRIGSSSLK
jgi:hypothetical protein